MDNTFYLNIGNTPIVKIDDEFNNTIYLKMENRNPSGSIKDRVFKTILDYYEKNGILKRGMNLTIASSGNAAISLACLGQNRGYKVTCFLPSSTTLKRRQILTLLNVDTYYVDGGMAKCIKLAKEKGQQVGSFYVDQFNDRNMLKAHVDTASEIIEAIPHLDYFISGVGSGVTVNSLGKILKNHYNLKIVAFEPSEARHLSKGEFKSHALEGVGPNFTPSNLLGHEIDEIVEVEKDEAFDTCLKFNSRGLLIGITTASLFVAIRKANIRDSKILLVCYDGSDKYMEVLTEYEKERRLL